jgi:hypothetical protein
MRASLWTGLRQRRRVSAESTLRTERHPSALSQTAPPSYTRNSRAGVSLSRDPVARRAREMRCRPSTAPVLTLWPSQGRLQAVGAPHRGYRIHTLSRHALYRTRHSPTRTRTGAPALCRCRFHAARAVSPPPHAGVDAAALDPKQPSERTLIIRPVWPLADKPGHAGPVPPGHRSRASRRMRGAQDDM